MAKAARQGKMTYLSWGVLTLLAPLCNQMEPTFEGFPFFFLVSFPVVPPTSLCAYGANKLGAP
jgi:hypothetical protein